MQLASLSNETKQHLTQTMGWFSLGLGVSELLMPEQVSATTGVRSRRILKLCGLREIASAVGILTSSRPAFWMWSRVVGDVVDLAVLGTVANSRGRSKRSEAMIAMGAVAGVTLIDVFTAWQLSQTHQNTDRLGDAVPDEDSIDDTIEDSFPASDPPSYSPVIST